MAFDVNEWLKELGFSGDEISDLAPKLGGKADVLEKGYLRQSDYSRQMNGLKAEREKLTSENEKLNRDMAEWAELTASEREQATALKQRIQASERKIFDLTQKLTDVAESNGMDPKQLLGDAEPAKRPEPEAKGGYDPDAVNNMVRTMGQFNMRLVGVIPRIAREHQALTGQEFDTEAFVSGLEADLRSGKAQRDPDLLDPIKRWERQFEVPNLRAQRSQADLDAKIQAAKEEGRRAGLSEARLPGAGQPVGSKADSSTVFRSLGTGSKLQRPQPGDRLAGARAALESHKYGAGAGRSAQ